MSSLRTLLSTLLVIAGGALPLQAAKPTSPLTLTELKGELARGLRSRFPVGTLERKGDHFLLVRTSMSWPEAQSFAESHGAHLAVLPDTSTQQWFREGFPSKEGCWLGAGKSADEQWQWIDGSRGQDLGAIRGDTSIKRHLLLRTLGSVGSATSTGRFQVALQWRGDGTNPGTLEDQLQRTAASAQAGSSTRIEFPVGTFTHKGSNFFYHRKALSWNDARIYAASLGATLAVPSSSSEQTWISATYRAQLNAGDRIWLGGFRLKPYERWQWLSKESWHNSGWDLAKLTESPENNRLALANPSGSREAQWLASNGTIQQSDGFLLEWAAPSAPVTPSEIDWKPWFDGARAQVEKEVAAELVELQKSRKFLVAEYVSGMKKLARSESRKSLPLSFERSLESAAKSGQPLDTLPKEAPETLRSYHEGLVDRFATLEIRCEKALASHLTFFAKGVEKRSDALAQNGFIGVALRLNQTIAPIYDPSFLGQLVENPSDYSLPWSRK